MGMNVIDLAQARAYYEQLMPMLSFELFFSKEDEFAYRPAGGKPGTYIFFYAALEAGSYSRHGAGLQHLAFVVKSRAAVDRVYNWAIGRGDEIIHAPQEFPQYHPGYYATFWHDPEDSCSRQSATAMRSLTRRLWRMEPDRWTKLPPLVFPAAEAGKAKVNNGIPLPRSCCESDEALNALSEVRVGKGS